MQNADATRVSHRHSANITNMKAQDFSRSLGVLGWSQAEFARRLGVDPTTVSRWVSASRFPKWAGEYLRLAVLVKTAID
ncbi:helix-turn-helix transcriptional regulator [Burkholderia cenocepacia]|uniref:helix-turn-helix domain-containing protein n=1 Tax=Burkholderia cenocepacia TaxID=95486 RepID=UPI0023BA1F70|nr:helix-turn-helix transcriptional regulator [Burkholderia cenocepacia]MDF0506554.1 helix-turn-helix transcriptional regulator [Burkholderia cenocepacia]